MLYIHKGDKLTTISAHRVGTTWSTNGPRSIILPSEVFALTQVLREASIQYINDTLTTTFDRLQASETLDNTQEPMWLKALALEVLILADKGGKITNSVEPNALRLAQRVYPDLVLRFIVDEYRPSNPFAQLDWSIINAS